MVIVEEDFQVLDPMLADLYIRIVCCLSDL